MKVIVQRNEQTMKVTYDLKNVQHAYAIREALKAALKEWGTAEGRIAEIFNEGTPLKEVELQTEEK